LQQKSISAGNIPPGYNNQFAGSLLPNGCIFISLLRLFFFMKRYQVIKLLVAALLCIATICIYYPGSYSNDTWGQYIHQSIDYVDDWWGPGLSYLWKYLMKLTGSLFSLYYLQMVAYWTLLALLVWHCRLQSARFWVVMGLGVLFSFMAQYLMRDTLMALAWGFAFLLMLRLSVTRHIAARIFIVVLIVLLSLYGLILRSNAVVALIPLALGLFVAAAKKIRWTRAIAYSIILSGLLIFFAARILYDGFDATRTYPEYKLKMLDVTGITKLTNQNYIPACLTDNPQFDSAFVMNNYTPATFDEIYWSGTNVIPPPDSAVSACVSQSWKKAIREQPIAYLQNRTEGFLYYLRIKKRFKNEEFLNANIEIDPNNPVGLKTEPRFLRDKFKQAYGWLSLTPFFDTWLWLLLNIACFAYTVFKYRQNGARHLAILACIQLSAIVYLISQIPVYQHDRDFRYNYWNVMILILTIGTLRDKRYNQRIP
jgi:hypothetical protein